ncbi:hypothetical protein Afe04nite_13240 [Asanoa ferruginea]|nr:hypothetical protein Afe04nite_13240 [Asanoa ferruginea]
MSGPAPDVGHLGAQARGQRQFAEEVEHRPLDRHRFHGADQALRIPTGEHVVRVAKLFGLGIHGRRL